MTESWYIVREGRSEGPHDLGAMRGLVTAGVVHSGTQVCRVGASAWSRADADEALRPLVVDAVPAVVIGPWSIGHGFRLAKAWKGPCWGSIVGIGLIWFALSLPEIVLEFMSELLRQSESQSEVDLGMALQGGASVLTLLTRILVDVPVQSALGVMGASAIAGTLRVGDMFVGYRRLGGILGATMVFWAGVALVYLVVMLILVLGFGALSAWGSFGSGGVGFGAFGMIASAVAAIIVVVFGVRRIVRYSLGPSIVCDPAHRSVGVFGAFAMSARALKGHEGSVFGFYVLLFLVAALSALLLGVGLLLIGFPLSVCGYGAVYTVFIRRLSPTAQPSSGA